MDALGGLKMFSGPAKPRKIIQAAVDSGVIVLGIRAVGAGSLCDEIDRELPCDTPEQIDWYKARKFRTLAKSWGVSSAFLAHRYSLSMTGVDTVILGVKNRKELDECMQAARMGPLTPEEIALVDQSLASAML
jgi:aryl-alcohol dehydrogenase-like predicted oxidoreductase